MEQQSFICELTRKERKEIHKLVTGNCANYDKEYGCLPLDYGRCYMLDKWWTSALCKYFVSSVLPLNLTLEKSLSGQSGEEDTRICPVCGNMFTPTTCKVYCSANCGIIVRREQNRINQKNKRKRKP